MEATTYNPTRPIVNIFTAISEYTNMSGHADADETSKQLMNIGLIIITRSTLFDSNIRKWHDKDDAAKTWTLFKYHFKATQKAIKRTKH